MKENSIKKIKTFGEQLKETIPNFTKAGNDKVEFRFIRFTGYYNPKREYDFTRASAASEYIAGNLITDFITKTKEPECPEHLLVTYPEFWLPVPHRRMIRAILNKFYQFGLRQATVYSDDPLVIQAFEGHIMNTEHCFISEKMGTEEYLANILDDELRKRIQETKTKIFKNKTESCQH